MQLKIHRPIPKEYNGLSRNTSLLDLLGDVVSLNISLNPSIIGWIIPKEPPTIEGPTRLCSNATKLRSTKLKKAELSIINKNEITYSKI